MRGDWLKNGPPVSGDPRTLFSNLFQCELGSYWSRSLRGWRSIDDHIHLVLSNTERLSGDVELVFTAHDPEGMGRAAFAPTSRAGAIVLSPALAKK
jgi:hypothetical protein